MEPEQLKKLTAPFPKEALKSREGGRGKQLTYVAGHTVIHRLNDCTGNNWNLEILSVTSEQIQVRDKPAEQVRAHVRLTIPGLGSREHVGVQILSAGGGEDLYKGAITDALKKSATLFGVGLELYGEDYEDESYTPSSGRPSPTPTRPPDATPRPAQAAPGPSQPVPIDSKAPRTEQQAREVQDLIDATESDAIAICRYYRVGSLGDLTKPQAEHLIGTLRAKARKLAEATS